MDKINIVKNIKIVNQESKLIKISSLLNFPDFTNSKVFLLFTIFNI